MSWTVLVPVKLGAARKSRLAPHLSPDARERLSEAMAAHVLACVAATPGIAKLIVLSPAPFGEGIWRADLGRGLNAELDAARVEIDDPFAVLLADLPLLRVEELAAMLAAAEKSGVALAPDIHRLGTNALALADARAFRFEFGPGSLARHLAQAPSAAIIERPGLQRDIDTNEDLQAARELGFRFEV